MTSFPSGAKWCVRHGSGFLIGKFFDYAVFVLIREVLQRNAYDTCISVHDNFDATHLLSNCRHVEQQVEKQGSGICWVGYVFFSHLDVWYFYGSRMIRTVFNGQKFVSCLCGRALVGKVLPVQHKVAQCADLDLPFICCSLSLISVRSARRLPWTELNGCSLMTQPLPVNLQYDARTGCFLDSKLYSRANTVAPKFKDS